MFVIGFGMATQRNMQGDSSNGSYSGLREEIPSELGCRTWTERRGQTEEMKCKWSGNLGD